MKTSGFANFSEFWPFYLSQHRDPLNRRLHFVGTTLVNILALTAIVTRNPMLLLALPIGGYGFAWFGHFIIEKNRPATFKHPIWSLMGDYKMYGHMLTGRLWGPAPAQS